MQETCNKSSSSSSDQIVEQRSKIMMLNAELETLRKEKKQLIDIHSKHASQKEISTQTDDQVCIYST